MHSGTIVSSTDNQFVTIIVPESTVTAFSVQYNAEYVRPNQNLVGFMIMRSVVKHPSEWNSSKDRGCSEAPGSVRDPDQQ